MSDVQTEYGFPGSLMEPVVKSMHSKNRTKAGSNLIITSKACLKEINHWRVNDDKYLNSKFINKFTDINIIQARIT